MSKYSWGGLIKMTENALRKHAPGVLMGLGISGMVSTAVVAVYKTPEALRRIDKKKKQEKTDKLTVMQTIQAAGPCYIPSVVMGAASIGCLIGSNQVSHRRNVALATAYQLSETAFRSYRDRVVETIGERKEQGIREKTAQDRLDQAEPKNNVIVVTGSGQSLCYDTISEREFLSDMETLRKAWNDFNYRLRTEMYLSYNEWLDMLGLPHHSVGDDLGWNVDTPMEINFTTAIRKGVPCIVVDYAYSPPAYRYKLY